MAIDYALTYDMNGKPMHTGDRVEIHTRFDLWMRGARFGTVTKIQTSNDRKVMTVTSAADKNGAVRWYARWMGGPSLALIRNCPTIAGPRTVYITGEPDTFFSQPAACKIQGKVYRGYIYFEDECGYFNVVCQREI